MLYSSSSESLLLRSPLYPGSEVPIAPPASNNVGVDSFYINLFDSFGNVIGDILFSPGTTYRGDILPTLVYRSTVAKHLPVKFSNLADSVWDVVVKLQVVAAVNVNGGAKNVDRALVVSFLSQIVVLLQVQVALKDLMAIVVADLTLNGAACTLRELAGLIILLTFYILWLLLNVCLPMFNY